VASYRENADPHVDEELHQLDVSTAKGGTLVGLVFGVALIAAIAYATCLFAGPPPGMEGYEWTFAVPALVFGLVAFLLHRRRARSLCIVRHGETIRLEVGRDGVLLTFPITLHGTQFRSPVGRVAMTEVYLQLVGSKGDAVTLHEVRGQIHGAYEDWFPGDIDKSVRSVRVYDVGGFSTLAKVRAWVENVNREVED